MAKPDGGVRQLGIPTVLDRFIPQAGMPVRHGRGDPTFSEHRHGFRPPRSAHQAVAKAQHYSAAGQRWGVDLDVEKFLDRGNPDRWRATIARRGSDKRMRKRMRAFLESGGRENGRVSPVEEGTPQAGPRSPRWSNLGLDELDREWERRQHRCVRYAEDGNSYVASERAGKRVRPSGTRFIRRRRQLQGKEAKSAVARPQSRKFLGFSFTAGAEGKRRIAPKARLRGKPRVRERTRRTRGIRLEQRTKDRASYLRGGKGYFGYGPTPSGLHGLDQWIRRRLRSVIWKQKKRRSSWRLAHRPARSAPFPTAYFDSLGLPRLFAG